MRSCAQAATLPRWISRHAIEDLSRGSAHTEIEVARRAVRKAGDSGGIEQNAPERDPGFYLLSRGRVSFEKDLAFRISLRSWLDRVIANTGMQGYLVTITSVSGLILALPLLGVPKAGVTWYDLSLLALLAVIPLSDLAVALVNLWIMKRDRKST